MTMQFQKATRQAVRLKIAIAGPSGSGKTLGALALAKVLAGEGTIAVIDTENGSASLYGDKYPFDVVNLGPPYTSARYLEAMEAAIEGGYSVLVIDSLTHQWNGDGGILSRKEEMDKRPGANSYTNWATFTKEHTAFLGKVLQLPVHVIATLRSKQDYVLETNSNGKQQPKKVGMAPVQREGLEYEFSTVFDVQMDHKATASKDRTGLFEGEMVDLVKPAAGKKLLAWLASGAPVKEPVAQPEEPAPVKSEVFPPVPKWLGLAADRPMPMGPTKGKTLGQHTVKHLREIKKWCEDKDKDHFALLIHDLRVVLNDKALHIDNSESARVERMKTGVEAADADLPFEGTGKLL